MATVAAAAVVAFDALARSFAPSVESTLARDIVVALAAVAVLATYFRLRARALSPAITEARLQALQARIRPHFLFNASTGCSR